MKKELIILSVSDVVEKALYHATTRDRFADVDLVLGCGDLPYYYLEFIADALNVQVLFIRGNHDATVEISEDGNRRKPLGAVDLHRRVVYRHGLIIAGLGGALQYRPGMNQYTQLQMWLFVLQLLPRLLWQRIVHGRWLDILVTHAPPWGIHDQSDPAHRGFKAIRWLIETFTPRLMFHGHVSVENRKDFKSLLNTTTIINTYGYRKTNVQLNGFTLAGNNKIDGT